MVKGENSGGYVHFSHFCKIYLKPLCAMVVKIQGENEKALNPLP